MNIGNSIDDNRLKVKQKNNATWMQTYIQNGLGPLPTPHDCTLELAIIPYMKFNRYINAKDRFLL